MKYQHLYDQLRRSILRGEYAPDAKLPSENALAIKYQVSRITTKRALNELAADDLIYRIQGKGSFVKPHQATNIRTLLLVLPFGADESLGDYASGITQTLIGTTWALATITNSQFAEMPVADLPKQYAGIFYYPQSIEAELPRLMMLAELHMPVVVLDSTPAALALPSVTSDNVSGGQLAVEHLLAAGHSRIAFYSHVPFWGTYIGTVADRFFGYLNHYATALPTGQPLAWAKALTATKTGEQLAEYLKQERITALIVANDIEAINLSRTLSRLNWQLPEQLAIIGFDNLPAAANNQPPLTTLTQDFKEIGRQAVDLLLLQINNPTVQSAARITVPVQLVVRHSTASKETSN